MPKSRTQTGRVMLGAVALTALGTVPPFLLGAQAVLMQRDLSFSASSLGVAVSIFFATAALTTILGARFLERWSERGLRILASLLVMCGAFGLSMASAWGHLAIAMAVLGASNAACQGLANRAVASLLPATRRGLGFGIKQSAVPAAIMMAGLAVPTTSTTLGWRSTYLVLGAAGIALLASALCLEAKEASTRHPRRAPRDGGADDFPVVDRPPRRLLLLCGAAVALASMGANFLGAYLASWGHQVGLSTNQAGVLLAVSSATSVAARVLIGHRADLRSGGNFSRVAGMMWFSTASLFFLGLFGQPWAAVTFGGLAIAVGWSWPGLMLYAVARVGRDEPAQASTVVQAGAFLGGAAGPALLGGAVSAVGFREAWWFAAGGFFIAGVLTLLARGGFRRDLDARPPRTPMPPGRPSVK